MLRKINQDIKFELGSLIVSSLPFLCIIAITKELADHIIYSIIGIYITVHFLTLYKYDVRKTLKTYNTTNIYNGLTGRFCLALIPITIYLSSDIKQTDTPIIFLIIPILTLIEPLAHKRLFRDNTIVAENIRFEKVDNRSLITMIINWHIILSIICIEIARNKSQAFFILELTTIIEGIFFIFIFKDNKNTLKKSNDYIQKKLKRLKPKFALYYAAPYGTEYQVRMWIEYLEKINLPFIIILRQPHALSPIKSMTTAPVFLCQNITSLDYIVTNSLTTCFYVNNAMHNTHMVRYSHLNHIQLSHGDSDKSASYNPINAMYDKIFVAGQAGIDRYTKNRISIPHDKFEIVGRPQVENIKTFNINQTKSQTILYAPTWNGYYQDLSHSSLPIAEKIISKALKIGARVIFRPHPYSYKSKNCNKIINTIKQLLKEDFKKNGTSHIYGLSAEKEMSIFDCFNNCDAMISDVSSVVSDFLFSEKPFIITNMIHNCQNPEENFPTTKAGYILNHNLSNLEFALNELLNTDSKKIQRKLLKSYFLGDFDKENYAENFIKTSTRIITNP